MSIFRLKIVYFLDSKIQSRSYNHESSAAAGDFSQTYAKIQIKMKVKVYIEAQLTWLAWPAQMAQPALLAWLAQLARMAWLVWLSQQAWLAQILWLDQQ